MKSILLAALAAITLAPAAQANIRGAYNNQQSQENQEFNKCRNLFNSSQFLIGHYRSSDHPWTTKYYVNSRGDLFQIEYTPSLKTCYLRNQNTKVNVEYTDPGKCSYFIEDTGLVRYCIETPSGKINRSVYRFT